MWIAMPLEEGLMDCKLVSSHHGWRACMKIEYTVPRLGVKDEVESP